MGKRILQLVSLLVIFIGWILMQTEETYAVTDYSNEYYTEDNQFIYCNEYDWYIGDGTNKYMLCQYLGSDTAISLPEEISGIPVVKFASLLTDNDTVKELYIPKTISYISISSNVSLENIYVDLENATFFSDDGVLYRKDGKEINLYCYPSNHSGDTFVVPDYVTEINDTVFSEANNLTTIIINENVQEIGWNTIWGKKNRPLTIYLNKKDLTNIFHPLIKHQVFRYLADGSKIVVKNEAAKEIVEEYVNDVENSNCGSVEVISMAEHPEYAVPAESLAFKDGTTEQTVTMSPNDCKALYGIYNQLPSACTENITWESSSPNIVSVETGYFSEDGQSGTGIHMEAKSCGECDVVGTNESGMRIAYHVKVAEPVSSLRFEDGRDMICYSLKNYDVYSEAFDFDVDKYNEMLSALEQQYEETAEVRNIYSGELAVNRMLRVYIGNKNYSDSRDPGYTVSFTSSDPSVARVESDGNPGMLWTDYDIEGQPYYRRLLAKLSMPGKTGEAEITASVTDWRGNTSQASFTVIVEEDPFEGNCTKYVALEDFGVCADGMLPFTEGNDNFGVNHRMDVGRTYQMGIETEPEECTAVKEGLRQEWAVGDSEIAQLVKKEDGSYELSMLKAGETTLTVTVYDGDKMFRKTYPIRTETVQNAPGMNTGQTVSQNNSGVNTSQNTSGTDSSVNGRDLSGSNVQEQKQPAVTVKKTSVKTVKASGKKALTVKWKKVSGAKGYQVQASAKKSFKSAKKLTVKKGSVTTAKVKGLKAGKKYYVRVRAYKAVNGKKVYGKWSKVKTCKTK